MIAVAERSDESARVVERAEFFGDGSRLFGFSHEPMDGARAGVLICSPIYAEFVRNYRREVLIGRRLAAAGVAVQRFHYRGHGNSDGDASESTFETMRADAIAAFAQLTAERTIPEVAVFGTRFGSLIAGSIAQELDFAPLVVWDPVLEGSQYLRAVIRTKQIMRLKASYAGTTGVAASSLLSDLERNGVADVIGYEITQALYESSKGRSLIELVGDGPRSFLIVSLGKDPQRTREAGKLQAAWSGDGKSVDVLTSAKPEPWWFSGGAVVSDELLDEPVDVTFDWLSKHLVGS